MASGMLEYRAAAFGDRIRQVLCGFVRSAGNEDRDRSPEASSRPLSDHRAVSLRFSIDRVSGLDEARRVIEPLARQLIDRLVVQLGVPIRDLQFHAWISREEAESGWVRHQIGSGGLALGEAGIGTSRSQEQALLPLQSALATPRHNGESFYPSYREAKNIDDPVANHLALYRLLLYLTLLTGRKKQPAKQTASVGLCKRGWTIERLLRTLSTRGFSVMVTPERMSPARAAPVARSILEKTIGS